jgi:hypothetical protein
MGAVLNPDIVTDGLILCLDAGLPKSYPGDGSIWYDISGNNKNFTIENNAVFSNGYFNFAGGTLGQRAVLNNSGMSFVDLTIEIGVRIKSNDGGYNGIFSGRLGSGNDFGNGLVLDLDNGSSTSFNRLNIESQTNGLLNRDALDADIAFNTWVLLSVTIDDSIANQYKIYVNGYLNYFNTYNGSTIYLDNISLGQRYYSNTYQSASCLDGDISFFRIYNKSLSATDILKNYKALKGRYD